MSAAYSNTDTAQDTHTRVFTTTETKPSFKTSEMVAYVVVALGVLIASAIVDDGDFGAKSAWFYVTLLTIGYMVSRGLAKAGSYEKEHRSNDHTGR